MTTASLPISEKKSRERITSIDAVRGLNMFLMICVNNLAHNQFLKPQNMHWLEHTPPGVNGMTFVDIVFPGFLFIAGMSIPFALTSRLNKVEPIWKIFGHVLLRVLSLIFIGIMMVNGRPDPAKFGWSAAAWQVTMCASVIAAFCWIPKLPRVQLGVRLAGFAMLIYLAFAFRGPNNPDRIISLHPFYINTQWWGILGVIGWAYLVGSIVFLLFRTNQAAVLGCTALLVLLYFADKTNTFAHFWPAKYLSFGNTLGTHSMLTTAGMMLGIMLMDPNFKTVLSRLKFTLVFIAGFAIAALLLNGQYGISKLNATPSWGLWSCAFTATAWLILYLLGDVLRLKIFTVPLAIAGQNVLLAYIISLAFNSTLNVTHLSHWYTSLAPNLNSTLIRSAGTAVFTLVLTYLLNLAGFALKL